ncbi:MULTISPECIES: thymidylate synthase [Micromonospora]|uniref:thymidylate synthase n=1 Tax=Micromonospora TaxID=1873 RepID=UPI0024A423F9|nr:thymidylate synthase [Micromonospora sp. NBRC 107095]GLZ56977.1 hypothetical protein Misp05_05530 [Micromonospora sp. NBRC 107095]
MAHAISDDTADGIWQAVFEMLGQRSRTHRNSVRGGSQEINHVFMTLADPRQRWVLSRNPPINPAFAIAEVIWIIQGRDDAAFLTHWNSRLPSFVGDDAHLHGAYGRRLRSHLGFDQLDRVYRALAARPDTRQAVLQIWDAPVDFPGPDGSPAAEDIPCNVVAMLKVVGGRLNWSQIMRSNDAVLGLPYNLVQWTTLQEIVAGWLGVDVGEYNHYSDSLHVYEHDFGTYSSNKLDQVLTSADLRLDLDQSKETFRVLEEFAERLVAGASVREEELADARLGAAYRDWVRVLVAEDGRRRGDVRWLRWAQEIDCVLLKEAMRLWVARFDGSAR